MLNKLKRISTHLQFSNPYWDYRIDEYTLPNGEIGKYYYVDSRGSTFIIPQLNQYEYVMVRQYRYLNQKESLEFPGGGIKLNLDPLNNAKEELIEETGYISNKWKFIGEFNPFNGVTNEICYVFLAEDVKFDKKKPEFNEQTEIEILKEKDIINKIKRGEIWDGMTLAAWMLYQSMR